MSGPPIATSGTSDPIAGPSPVAAARRLRYDLLALFLAIVGGGLGIVGAFVQEFQAGLLIFIGAPIIEEALKPAGIYILLIRWPQALRGRLHTAVLAGISGLSFGLIESLVYITIYYPEGGSDFVLFRFTLTPALHFLASFLFGLGLSRALVDWAAGRARLPKATRNCYVAAVALHAVYNTAAVLLAVTGVIDFD